MTAADGIVFRPMEMEDLNRIVLLERELFSDPWEAKHFVRDIKDRTVGFAVVGEEHGSLICYGIVWQAGLEFHIVNMAVRANRQGCGVGGLLLMEMLKEGRRRGCESATLEVRCSNRRAIALYRSHGFLEVAIRKGYYVDNGEDALVMIRNITTLPGENSGLVSKKEEGSEDPR